MGVHTTLGVSACVALVILDIDATKTPDLDPVAPCESSGHFVEEQPDDFRSFCFCEAVSFFSASMRSALFVVVLPRMDIKSTT